MKGYEFSSRLGSYNFKHIQTITSSILEKQMTFAVKHSQ